MVNDLHFSDRFVFASVGLGVDEGIVVAECTTLIGELDKQFST